MCIFCRYSDHPDLHSFPTRRSSDLGVLVAVCGARGILLANAATFVVSALLIATGVSRRPAPAAAPATGSRRSEEHTSELQSHVNLVCRLLLEKKNEYYQIQYSIHAI